MVTSILMTIPTEPIGSIPRPPRLIEAVAAGDGTDPKLDALYEQLGTMDDCGFSPFCDDTSTTRDTAFAKIRVLGTGLASKQLGIG
jgi:hypothetical protein